MNNQYYICFHGLVFFNNKKIHLGNMFHFFKYSRVPKCILLGIESIEPKDDTSAKKILY